MFFVTQQVYPRSPKHEQQQCHEAVCSWFAKFNQKCPEYANELDNLRKNLNSQTTQIWFSLSSDTDISIMNAVFVCVDCGREFYVKAHLLRHNLVHKACKYCSKTSPHHKCNYVSTPNINKQDALKPFLHNYHYKMHLKWKVRPWMHPYPERGHIPHLFLISFHSHSHTLAFQAWLSSGWAKNRTISGWSSTIPGMPYDIPGRFPVSSREIQACLPLWAWDFPTVKNRALYINASKSYSAFIPRGALTRKWRYMFSSIYFEYHWWNHHWSGIIQPCFERGLMCIAIVNRG